ncbi:major facilitator superfamily domain-containing protein [Microdochium bolleyi]|uniref:Major facilitator superfamily domain-containing protein n=1 Tax=Microdochium bolleyi TaxID=196109 RepID=A0A136JCX3_9PEZI|nr:major facilitator superfamily domain-containing protein [Microdochium bolleyi]
MLSLCITGLLGALENTVVTTSLPTIVEALQIGQDYIWITNVFFLTSALVQPLFGQLANIFGRRWLTIAIVAIYTLGSGICGGANNAATLIAGRAVQGIGSGGVNMIVDVIISDLVPLRERGNYIAIVLTVYAIGTSLGPFVGGIIVETTSWRWVFYINLPVGGAALILLYLFLRVKTSSTSKEMTLKHKLRRIDYTGNAILMGATIAILYALTYGGASRPWTDGTVLAPLIIGLVGLVAFMVYEGSSLPIEPVTPLRLFNHRTGAIVAINTFMNSVLLYWAMFFLPVYFQAVLGSSPSWSGVQLLPIVLVAVPGAIVSVIVLSKWGRYKELHLLGFAIETISLGLFSLLGPNSSTAEWAIYQILAGLGSGMILNTLLPAFQAGLAEADQAAATASWAFIRSFGNIWGVAIPAAIFSNEFSQHAATTISDPAVRNFLSGGNSYQQATASYIGSLVEPVRSETISTYSQALKLVWYISVVFSGIAFVLAIFEKAIPLRKELETDFGLEEEKKTESSGELQTNV